MAVIARGITRCAHCERVIQAGEEAVGFTVFVANAADPLYRFNDAAFHKACLAKDPLARAALQRQDEAIQKLGPTSHVCAVCGKRIESWRDNVALPFLDADGLQAFNYLQFHRTCLRSWPDLDRFTRLLSAAIEHGTMVGPAIVRLRDEVVQASA